MAKFSIFLDSNDFLGYTSNPDEVTRLKLELEVSKADVKNSSKIYVETLENLNNRIDEVQNLKDENIQVSTENAQLKTSLQDALQKYNAQKKITEAVQNILKRKCSELSEYDKLYIELQEFQ